MASARWRSAAAVVASGPSNETDTGNACRGWPLVRTGVAAGRDDLPAHAGLRLRVRDTQPAASRSLADPLTQSELRLLRLLPTTTIDQAGAALYISRNTVKTHLKAIYQKLGAASRSEAIQQAVDLRIL